MDKKRLCRGISEKDLDRLLDMLKVVNYGSITLVIQDGKVVQIEKSEKVRLVWYIFTSYIDKGKYGLLNLQIRCIIWYRNDDYNILVKVMELVLDAKLFYKCS